MDPRRKFERKQWGNQRDFWQIESRIFKGKVYPMMYQQLAFIEAMIIERRGEMFSQSIKNCPGRKVSNGTMVEPEGNISNRIKNIQEEGVWNDVPRARIHRCYRDEEKG